jgi:hypothetical protein
MPLKPNTIVAYNDKGEWLDLTSKLDATGKLNWTAPAGNWKLYALFIGWHGKMVERAAPGGEGDVIDHFNAPALQHYLARFDEAFKAKDLSGIRSFFNDSYEVDDARGQSNWTPGFFTEFSLRRGYDLKKYIPQLFGRDSSDIGRRVFQITVKPYPTCCSIILQNPGSNGPQEKIKCCETNRMAHPPIYLICMRQLISRKRKEPT